MRVVRFFKRVLGNGRGASLVSIFTPREAQDQGTGTRLLLAGGTMAVLGVALASAATAAALLLLAVGVIYYLLSQVLGIKLDIDPRTLMQQAQRYASASSAPN